MPLNFVEQKTRQKYLIVAAIIIFLLAGIIVWYGYFGQNLTNPFAQKNKTEPVDAFGLQSVSIDFAVFENELLKNLEPFAQLPAYDGKLGRDNPFIK